MGFGACFGSGATLAVPGPVGGVVSGCTTGAERDAPVEPAAVDAPLVDAPVVSGAGGALGTSEGGIVLVCMDPGLDGVVNGAGLGSTASPGPFFSSAKKRWATRHCGRAAGAIDLRAGRARRREARSMMSCRRRTGDRAEEGCG